MGTSKVRTLELTEAFIGGVKTHVLQLLRGLPSRRFLPTLVYSADRDPALRDHLSRELPSGVRAIEIPMTREIHPVRDAASFLRIVRFLRGERFDVIHTHASKAGFLGRVAARLTGARALVHTAHTFAFQWSPSPMYLALERLAGRLTDRLVAVSESQGRLAEGRLFLPRSRLVVIENGVDERRFAPRNGPLPETPPVVGTLARLAPQKGVGHFLRVMTLLRCPFPAARGVLGGEGPLRERVLHDIDRLGLSGTVRFAGEVEDAPAFYRGLHVFALPSLWEGLPYVVLEAMACGIPVVASRIPGNADLVLDGETGFLTEPGDEAGMAERIGRLLQDRDLREEMGRRGRRRVLERFTEKRFLERTAALYEELAAPPFPPLALPPPLPRPPPHG